MINKIFNLNNKGFAITTILYGTLIIFIFLLLSMMGILGTYKSNLEKLIDSTNGARDIVTITKKDLPSNATFTTVEKRGLYCSTETTECKYVSLK